MAVTAPKKRQRTRKRTPKGSCFVIMPITTPVEALSRYGDDAMHFPHVLEHLFKPAIELAGFEPISPVATGADLIHAEIVRKLEESDLVLADMSLLNANVFFELGIRTAVDKPVALVKDNTTLHVPFDTTMLNHHTYDASLATWLINTEVERLRDHLVSAVNGSQGRNTMWRHFGLTTRAKPADEASVDAKLDFVLRTLERISVASSGTISGISGIEFDSDEDAVIAAAQALAGSLSAQFEVKSKSLGHVDLDLGSYALTPHVTAAIEEMASAMGVDVRITREIADAESDEAGDE